MHTIFRSSAEFLLYSGYQISPIFEGEVCLTLPNTSFFTAKLLAYKQMISAASKTSFLVNSKIATQRNSNHTINSAAVASAVLVKLFSVYFKFKSIRILEIKYPVPTCFDGLTLNYWYIFWF